jgi:hypothetical protein
MSFACRALPGLVPESASYTGCVLRVHQPEQLRRDNQSVKLIYRRKETPSGSSATATTRFGRKRSAGHPNPPAWQYRSRPARPDHRVLHR